MNPRIADLNSKLIHKHLQRCAKIIFPALSFLAFAFQLNAQKTPSQTKTYLLDNAQGKVEISVYNNLNTSAKQGEQAGALLNSQAVTNCNTYSEIEATNFSQNGPLDEVGCQNSDSIEICFRVFNFNSGMGTNSCQYFHGLVPDFGTCLNVFPGPDGEPGLITQAMSNNSGAGVWQWFPNGFTTYNDIPNGYLPPGEPVGAGWFYILNPGSNPQCTDYSDPNCTWGDGLGCNDNNGAYWEVCFLAEPVCTEPGTELCEISFRTFGDGETGGWEMPGCENDQVWTYSFTKTCCEEPIITNTELDFTVCSGELFELELTSNMDPETTYDWYALPNAHGASSGTGTIISDILTNNTGSPVNVTYIVTPTCAFGCVGEQITLGVTILPEVEVELWTQNIICEGDCIDISAQIQSNSPYASCMWNNGIVDVPTIFDCPSGNSVYSLTITDIYGCTGEASVFVEVFETLIAEVGPDQEITCAIPNCQLQSIGNELPHLVPQWTGPGIDAENANLPAPVVDQAGVYELIIINTQSGCISESVSLTVTENTIPPLNEIIQLGVFDCHTESVVLTSLKEEEINYQWIFPDGQIIIDLTVEVFEPGIYTLIATDPLNGCSTTVNLEVEDLRIEPLADAGLDQQINCIEETAILDGTASETGADIIYQWFGTAGEVISGDTEMEAIVSSEGMYILQVINTINNCMASDTVIVTADQTLPVVEAGPNQEFSCEIQLLELNGFTTSDMTNISWMDQEDAIIAQNLEVEISQPGWYFLQIINEENGCSAKDSVLITANEDLPSALTLETQGTSCFGYQDGFIEILAVNGGQQPYQFSFNGAAYSNQNSWDLLAAGNYPVVVKDAEGCTYETIVEIPERAPILLDIGEDMLIELGESHTLQAQTNLESDQIEGVYWTPVNQITCLDDDCLEISVSPVASTSLELYLVDTNGCTAEDKIKLRVKKKRGVFIPNIFTPNNDGINDVFYIQGLPSVKNVKRFIIYDRSGAVVFENRNFNINDPDSGWNGMYKGEMLDTGVFVYTVEVEFSGGYISVFKGDITLAR